MIYIEKEACKGCDLCIEFCPVDILEKAENLNKRGVYPPHVKSQEECINCENCMIYCPDFAIFVKEED